MVVKCPVGTIAADTKAHTDLTREMSARTEKRQKDWNHYDHIIFKIQ